MTLSLLVPFRDSGDGERTLVWNFVRHELLRRDPDLEIVEGDDGGELFSRSGSVNAAATQATGEYVAIWDADTFVDPEFIREACAVLAKNPKLGGVRPWDKKSKLNQEASERVLRGEVAIDDPSIKDEVDCYSTWEYASPTVHTRRAFDAVGGMDPKFRGWGSEDTAYGLAIQTLVGPLEHLAHPAVHIYHPYLKLGGARAWIGQTKEKPNWGRVMRYRQARGKPNQMRKLINGS